MESACNRDSLIFLFRKSPQRNFVRKRRSDPGLIFQRSPNSRPDIRATGEYPLVRSTDPSAMPQSSRDFCNGLISKDNDGGARQ
jgi:hypothetical protein